MLWTAATRCQVSREVRLAGRCCSRRSRRWRARVREACENAGLERPQLPCLSTALVPRTSLQTCLARLPQWPLWDGPMWARVACSTRSWARCEALLACRLAAAPAARAGFCCTSPCAAHALAGPRVWPARWDTQGHHPALPPPAGAVHCEQHGGYDAGCYRHRRNSQGWSQVSVSLESALCQRGSGSVLLMGQRQRQRCSSVRAAAPAPPLATHAHA